MEKEQKKTHYNGFQTHNKNYVWAGAMCLAWQELINNLIKEPISLNTKDKNTLIMIKNFNEAKFKKKDINQQSIYIKSGFGQQTLKTINKQVKQKFEDKTMPDLKAKMEPTSLISFAYLFKKIEFSQFFERNNKKTFKFNGIGVQSFYAHKKQQKKIVFYHSYQDENNFCIGIKTKCVSELFYLIKSQKNLSVDDAINQIIYFQNKGGYRYLEEIDQFQMPVIDLDCSRDLKQLFDLYFENKNWKQYQITKIFQSLKLKVDEKGAVVQNKAAIIALKRKKSGIKEPKKFLLNKDFWIVMKEKQKHPYLCVNIRNPIDLQ